MAPLHKWLTIPNGIPEPVPARHRDAVRQEFGISPRDILLFTHGRLVPEKGLEEVLHAARLLKTRLHAPMTLVLAGEGRLRPALEALARRLELGDRVRFLGFRSDIADLLAASDIVVLPSWREGMSIALLEAMALGKPLIVTSIGSNCEVTRKGYTACLVPPGDPDAIADAVVRLSKDPEHAAELARNARAVYENEYTLTNMLAGYHQMYLRLFAERGIPVNTIAPAVLEKHLLSSSLIAFDGQLRTAGGQVLPTGAEPARPRSQQSAIKEKSLA